MSIPFTASPSISAASPKPSAFMYAPCGETAQKDWLASSCSIYLKMIANFSVAGRPCNLRSTKFSHGQKAEQNRSLSSRLKQPSSISHRRTAFWTMEEIPSLQFNHRTQQMRPPLLSISGERRSQSCAWAPRGHPRTMFWVSSKRPSLHQLPQPPVHIDRWSRTRSREILSPSPILPPRHQGPVRVSLLWPQPRQLQTPARQTFRTVFVKQIRTIASHSAVPFHRAWTRQTNGRISVTGCTMSRILYRAQVTPKRHRT